MAKFNEQTFAVRQIILDLAEEFKFGHDSTIDEIDYKFWEDVEPEWIAIALAQKLAACEAKVKELQEF